MTADGLQIDRDRDRKREREREKETGRDRERHREGGNVETGCSIWVRNSQNG